MNKIQLTPDVENALKIFSMAVGSALEDEGIDEPTRARISSRATSMMADVVDGEYQHVTTITVGP